MSATDRQGRTTRLVNQNDCRTTDLDALAAHGPVDLHWLQYSGAIWYPMVYEMDVDTMRHLVDAKVDSQLTRAMRYVESIDARAIVPSAGPPCFLDDALFHLNIVDGNPDQAPSIFVDQRTFLARLEASGHRGVLAIPGTTIEVTPDDVTVTHPFPRGRGRGDLRAQGRVPRRVQGGLGAVARRDAREVERPARDRPPRDAPGVVGTAARAVPHGA